MLFWFLQQCKLHHLGSNDTKSIIPPNTTSRCTPQPCPKINMLRVALVINFIRQTHTGRVSTCFRSRQKIIVIMSAALLLPILPVQRSSEFRMLTLHLILVQSSNSYYHYRTDTLLFVKILSYYLDKGKA